MYIIFRIARRAAKALTFFLNAKKFFTKPKCCEVLIFDRVGSENFVNYFNPDDVHIMDVRGESINLYILLRSILYYVTNRMDYIGTYIHCVNPKFVITFIDNGVRFYTIKQIRPNMITIFFQNGYRQEVADIFYYLAETSDKKNNYHVDYMFTFSKAIGKKYSQYIRGQIVPIGSFKNNNFCANLDLKIEKNTLVFISQFREKTKQENVPFVLNSCGEGVSWDNYYTADKIVIKFLKEFCKLKGLSFKICGMANSEFSEEYKFYKYLLGEDGWGFLPKLNPYDGYVNTYSAEFVVFIDSTLGYEALAAGKKVASFSCRDEILKSHACNFGWPADLQPNGPFWSNKCDENELWRVMNYITTVDDLAWEKVRSEHIADVMECDAGNMQFLLLMQKLGAPLRKL